MTKNLILSFMLAICAFATCRAEENVVYSGPAVVSGWTGVDLSADVFSDVGAGDVVRVYASGFLGADKSGIAGFLSSGSALFPDETEFKVYGDFSLIVSPAIQSQLRSGGLTVSGYNYTIDRITLEKDPKNKVLFSGSVAIAYYTPTISVPKFQFQTAKIGDVIKVSVSNVTSDSRGCLQNSEWSELKSGYSGFEMTGDYSMVIDESVLAQLRDGVLRVRGAYHTVNKVTLYCPSAGYDVVPGERREAVMMFGLNESGGEFAGVYPGVDGTHYGYPNYDDLAYARRKGFGIIRLPFRWERVQRPLGSASLIKSETDKIKKVLDWASELGLKVVFDMHNFGRYCTYCNGYSSADNVYSVIGESSCTLDQFCDVWRMLAREFKDYECIWGYEIMNEPYAMLSSMPWFNIAQAAIYAIREEDMSTPIVVDGDQFATARNWVYYSDNLRNLNDPADNLIFSAHCYFDKDSSGEYKDSYENSGANAQTGVTRVKPFVDWCNKYGKRGYIGEYGIPDDDSRWNTVLDNTLAYLQENGMGGTYWSAGHRWGDYKLAVHPTNNYTKDRPQMSVLVKYQSVGAGIVQIERSDASVSPDAWYTLQGIKVENPGRGIFIHKGRKIVR
ncbi:glycoside hydrolase family 5 protein [Xylanibacter caecicola]|uniref:glycoside hydrolase family 5 protein n=1 Tax=Xylanibacter caecicola TaxID=2736294 RepID=UPI0020A697BB|nr:glycoside hydrolase family 5 protein [Xylanibacter caecicola]